LKGFVHFIKAVGIPGIIEGVKERNSTFDLVGTAVSNKLQPLLAQSLGLRGHNWLSQYNDLLCLLANVGGSLEGLNYAVIKTLRPIPHIPSDIDILVHPSDVVEASRRLKKDGLRFLSKVPYGVTLHDIATGFNVDLTEELSVAGLEYVSRDLVLDETTTHRIHDIDIRIPKPFVDLLIIMDHSVFKEWMYTLRDFYSTMVWLQHLSKTLGLASRESDAIAARLFLETTYLVAKEAIGENHDATRKLEKLLQKSPHGDISNLPHRYKFTDIIEAYIFKAKYFSKNERAKDFARYIPTFKASKLADFLTRKSY
jgi:hypothetical protein